jgi:hypothetical protein
MYQTRSTRWAMEEINGLKPDYMAEYERKVEKVTGKKRDTAGADLFDDCSDFPDDLPELVDIMSDEDSSDNSDDAYNALPFSISSTLPPLPPCVYCVMHEGRPCTHLPITFAV